MAPNRKLDVIAWIYATQSKRSDAGDPKLQVCCTGELKKSQQVFVWNVFCIVPYGKIQILVALCGSRYQFLQFAAVSTLVLLQKVSATLFRHKLFPGHQCGASVSEKQVRYFDQIRATRGIRNIQSASSACFSILISCSK